MINEIISMNGYGPYVWSAFMFTIVSFVSLYLVTKLQLLKEQKKYIVKLNGKKKQESEYLLLLDSQKVNITK